VNAADDIAEFLASRRARITPERAGLPSYGTRRVPGLRREEVASLAGVSADYYPRLERGQVSGVSELVLEAVAARLLPGVGAPGLGAGRIVALAGRSQPVRPHSA
jgi:transcriptional regulator with XRE-family HTH domain